MKVLVTGASGFLGTAVVRAAVAAGHDVVAMVRPAAEPRSEVWGHERVQVVRGDLRERGDWCHQVTDVEAVIHLAAAASGDLGTQFQGTVLATEILLDALRDVRLRRFVHVSSFSVYDFSAVRVGGVLDESSPIERDPATRDAYTVTKLLQEDLVVTAMRASGTDLVVIRPGAIFGPGKDWGYGTALGMPAGYALVFSPRASFRLTYVDNCADAIVRALTAPAAAGAVIDVVDDDLPSHLEYLRMFRRAGAPTPRPLPVPWVAVSFVGTVLRWIDRRLLAGRAKYPEFLAARRQDARWKPLRYSNAAAHHLLGWSPEVSIEDGVRRTVEATTR